MKGRGEEREGKRENERERRKEREGGRKTKRDKGFAPSAQRNITQCHRNKTHSIFFLKFEKKKILIL